MASFSALRTIANVKLSPGTNYAAPIVNQSITGIVGQITLRTAQAVVGTTVQYVADPLASAPTGMAIVVNDIANPQPIQIQYPVVFTGLSTYTLTVYATPTTPYVTNFPNFSGSGFIGTIALTNAGFSVTNVFLFYW